MSKRNYKRYCKVLTFLSHTLGGKNIKVIYDSKDLSKNKRKITIVFDDGSELSFEGKDLKYSYYAGKKLS